MLSKQGLLAFVATVLAGPISGEEFETLTHKIPPGYEPGPKREEQGLWSEMEDLELRINKSALLMDNGDLVNYINNIVCRVAGPYCNDLRVYVIRNPSFNASMMPNGMMHVWTGMIVRASSTDEIAAVVGHEIAHYTRLHSLELLEATNRRRSAGLLVDVTVETAEVGLPLGRLTALLGTLSFSRNKEYEADLLGVKLMADADYDPHASYMVWEKILAEEEAAVAKGIKAPAFIGTHPPSRQRADRLRKVVNDNYGPSSLGLLADQAFLDVMNSNYILLMNDQLATNRYGRTLEILRRHKEIGINPGLVNFFYGETYRQRGADGDLERAMSYYKDAIETGSGPPEAYRSVGYLLMKQGNKVEGSKAFKRYLELAHDPSDRAMIEFFLQDMP